MKAVPCPVALLLLKLVDISIWNGPRKQCFFMRRRWKSRLNWDRNNQFSRCIACKCNVIARKGITIGFLLWARSNLIAWNRRGNNVKRKLKTEKPQRGRRERVFICVEQLSRKQGRFYRFTPDKASKINFPKTRTYTVNTRNDRPGRHSLLLDLVWSEVMLDWGFRNFRVTWLQLQF